MVCIRLFHKGKELVSCDCYNCSCYFNMEVKWDSSVVVIIIVVQFCRCAIIGDYGNLFLNDGIGWE